MINNFGMSMGMAHVGYMEFPFKIIFFGSKSHLPVGSGPRGLLTWVIRNPSQKCVFLEVKHSYQWGVAHVCYKEFFPTMCFLEAKHSYQWGVAHVGYKGFCPKMCFFDETSSL